MIAADWTPTSRKLRQFSAMLVVVVIALAIIYRDAAGAVRAPVLVGILVALGLLGLVWPVVVRPAYVVMTVVTLPIGWALSHVLLRVVYYGVFSPLAAVFRLAGRDALLLRRRERSTYWEPFQQGSDIESYFRQT